MRKAVLFATLWTVLAIGNMADLIRDVNGKWFSLALILGCSCLSILQWLEVRALSRQSKLSSAEPPSA